MATREHSHDAEPTATIDASARTAPARGEGAHDNQALQSLYASGALRAQLQVGAADDPVEAEADRLAAAVMAGSSSCACAPGAPPCPGCLAKSGDLHRKAKQRGARGGTADSLSLGAERPLSTSERGFFEPRFNADFGGVRVHDNPHAAASAAQLGARAFSVGDRIAFGPGEYQAHTPEGQTLFAHELAHIALGHGGLRRQDGPMCSADAPSCEYGPPAPGVTRADEPAAVEHGDDFDPCKVEVTKLTNYELLAELNNAGPRVAAGRDAAGFLDYRNLQRRLHAEVGRRVDMGHRWLGALPAAIPGSLIQVSDAPDGTTTVVQVPGSAVSGAPAAFEHSPILTQAQFDSALERQRVQTMQADEYRRQLLETALAGGVIATTAGGQLYNNPLDAMLLDPFARSSFTSTGGPNQKWLGRLGEAGYQAQARSGYGMFLDDLNSRTWIDRAGRTQQPTSENFPVFDFERPAGSMAARVLGVARVSVKTSVQATQADRFAYFREGMASMLETSSRSALPTYIANDPQFGNSPASQYDANRSAVLRDAYLAINDEDVAGFRRMLSDPSARETPQHTTSIWDDRGQAQAGRPPRRGWRSLFEGEMRENPVRIGTQAYNSPDALDAARDAGTITAEQHATAQREIGSRLANRTVSAGISGAELTGLRNARNAFPTLTPQQISPLLSREYLAAQRHGGGISGNIRAAGGAGLRGAGISGGIAVITTLGVMWIDDADHPEWASELGETGTLAALGGLTGGATEQFMISHGTQMMLGNAAAGGTSRLTPALNAGLGRFGGGGVGAGFAELVSMGAFEPREHTWTEGGVRTGRAFVLGGTSAVVGAEVGLGATALAMGVAGLEAGTVVPGWGNAIGFVVGLAAGALVYAVGDYVVPGGRKDWDAYEAGCQPAPVSSPTTSRGFDSPMFRCFDADTPIAMADGSSVPIGEIVAGDVVLTYNEREGVVEKRPVTAVHAAEPAIMLRVACTGGRDFTVTPPHKLATTRGWRCAGELVEGDSLRCLGNGSIAVAAVESIELLPPRGVVYDLSVEATHTYFAGGVLAHNKLP